MGIGASFENVPDWTASDYLYEPESENIDIDGDEDEFDETPEDDDEYLSGVPDDTRRNLTECAIAVDMEDRGWGESIRSISEFFRGKYWIGNK